MVKNQLYWHSQQGNNRVKSNLKADVIAKLTYAFNRDNQVHPKLNDIVYVLDIPNLQTVKEPFHKGHWRIPQTDYQYVAFHGIIWNVTREGRRVKLKKTRLSLSKVLAIHTEVHTDDILEVKLTLKDDPNRTHRVITTVEHPFYVAQNQAYIPTKDIIAGHQLLSLKGPEQVLNITKTQQRGSKIMYNLSVSNPNYYINSGQEGGLKDHNQTEFNVHNMRWARRLLAAAGGKKGPSIWDSIVLKDNAPSGSVNQWGCPTIAENAGKITRGSGRHSYMSEALVKRIRAQGGWDEISSEKMEDIREAHGRLVARNTRYLRYPPEHFHRSKFRLRHFATDKNTDKSRTVVLGLYHRYFGIAGYPNISTGVLPFGEAYNRVSLLFGIEYDCEHCGKPFHPGSVLFFVDAGGKWRAEVLSYMVPLFQRM